MNSTKNPLYPFEPERLCLQASAVNQSSYTLLNIRVYHPYRFVDAYAGIHNDWHDQIWTHTREQGCKCRPNIHGTAVYQFRRTLSGFYQSTNAYTDRQASRQTAGIQLIWGAILKNRFFPMRGTPIEWRISSVTLHGIKRRLVTYLYRQIGYTYRKADRQTDKQTDSHSNRKTGRHKGTDKQKDMQAVTITV